MIAHLLGNGPSRKSFVPEPNGDVFGCNLSDETLPLTATFILDEEVFKHLRKKKQGLPWPIICPERWERVCPNMPVPLKIFSTVPRVAHLGENTGHHAAIWLILHGYTEVHLWGFDSMRDDTVESDSHQKIEGAIWSKKNIPTWRKLWEPILASKKTKFLIH